MNVLKLLSKDHSRVQNLFESFDEIGKSSSEKKSDLFQKIRRELQIHSRAKKRFSIRH